MGGLRQKELEENGPVLHRQGIHKETSLLRLAYVKASQNLFWLGLSLSAAGPEPISFPGSKGKLSGKGFGAVLTRHPKRIQLSLPLGLNLQRHKATTKALLCSPTRWLNSWNSINRKHFDFLEIYDYGKEKDCPTLSRMSWGSLIFFFSLKGQENRAPDAGRGFFLVEGEMVQTRLPSRASQNCLCNSACSQSLFWIIVVSQLFLSFHFQSC